MSRGSQESLRSPEYHALVIHLQKAWLASGMNQSEICRRLGRPNNYLNKIVKGERRIDIVEMFRLCEVIEADPLALLSEYIAELRKSKPTR